MINKGPWGGMMDRQVAKHFEELRTLGVAGVKQAYWYMKEDRAELTAQRSRRDAARMNVLFGGR